MTTAEGLTFSHDIAGHQVISLSANFGLSPSPTQVAVHYNYFNAGMKVSPTLTEYGVFLRQFSSSLSIRVSLSIALNVGFTNIITFGHLTLLQAEPIDWDEIDLSTREAKIWNGTLALDGDPVVGFNSKYRFWPRDWNDYEALLAMAGTKQTLRVYGKPYRNCMLVGRIRKKQIKKGYALWAVEIEIKQDTCMTGITS